LALSIALQVAQFGIEIVDRSFQLSPQNNNFIMFKNSLPRLFCAYFSKLAWLAKVICRVALPTLSHLYPV